MKRRSQYGHRYSKYARSKSVNNSGTYRCQGNAKQSKYKKKLPRAPKPRYFKSFDLNDVGRSHHLRHMLPNHTYIEGQGYVHNWNLHLQRTLNPRLPMPPGVTPWRPVFPPRNRPQFGY